MQLPSKKKHGITLRLTLVTLSALMIILSSLGVGTSAFFSSKKIINDLWISLSAESGQNAVNQIIQYFNHTIPFTETALDLFERKIINSEDDQSLIPFFYNALTIHPQFEWIIIDRPDGSSFDVFRNPQEPGSFFWIGKNILNPTTKEFENHVKIYKYEDKNLVLKRETLAPIEDIKPVYDLAINHPNGAWSVPYDYTVVPGIGFDYGRAIVVDEQFKGVLAVEYELTNLKQFLKTLPSYQTHHVYLITEQGEVLLESGEKDPEAISKKGFVSINDSLDSELKAAWHIIQQENQNKGIFETDKELGFYQKLPEISKIPWMIVMTISKDEFYAPIKTQTRHSIFIATTICLLGILVSSLLFTRISKRLKEIAVEMDEMTHLSFPETSLSHVLSWIQEIKMMNTAISHLKQGLIAFAKFVPIELVSNLIQSGKPIQIGGEKKQITVLFVDIASFTAYAETVPPDAIMKHLGSYLCAMNQEIEETSGIVDKYLGDGLMAFWGAPKEIKDHAIMACYAALKMKAKLQQLRQEWKRENTPLFQQRIGINTGEVIVGNIGSSTKMEYTAIGDSVNLASRLEALNKIYGTEIIVGPNVAEQVKEHFFLRPLDFATVRGKKEPILIYELISSNDSIPTNWKQAKEIYEKGLALFKEDQFEAAKQLFEQVSSILGFEDPPSLYMISKCTNPKVS